MTSIDQIIDRLIQLTEDGTLEWESSSNGDELTVSVDAFSVKLKWLEPDGFPVWERYRLAILNDDGSTVRTLETDDEFGFVSRGRVATPEQAKQMELLFAVAHRSALNIEATLAQLVKALEAF